MFMSNQVYGGDVDLLNVGGVYSGREPLLQLAFGGLKFALVELNNADAVTGTLYKENQFPALEMAYAYSQDNWNVKIAGGYQSYTNEMGGGLEIDVDSYIAAVSGGVNFGALYIKGNVYVGQNGGNLIALNTAVTGAFGGGGLAGINAAGNETDDNDIFGALIVVGGKINDMFSVEAGFSTASQELDSMADSDDVTSAYLQSTITFAPGVFVVPEIGMIDYDEAGQDEVSYFGAKWQINF
jgi:hypothetical protein